MLKTALAQSARNNPAILLHRKRILTQHMMISTAVNYLPWYSHSEIGDDGNESPQASTSTLGVLVSGATF